MIIGLVIGLLVFGRHGPGSCCGPTRACTFPRPMLGLVPSCSSCSRRSPRARSSCLGCSAASSERCRSGRRASCRHGTREFELRLQGLEQTLNTRLAATTQSTTQIHDRLGQMTQATAEMIEPARRSSESSSRRCGRPRLAAASASSCSRTSCATGCRPTPTTCSTRSTSGERVDAVDPRRRTTAAGRRQVPARQLRAHDGAEGDEQQLHERAFARDVKGHIDAIASKYIRPELGTFDLAFMYLPAEAIHYELVSGKTGALLAYAHERRVFPVSATTFSAYLQMIVLGLKGMQIEQRARRGHALLRGPAEGVRQVQGRLRSRRHAPLARAREVRRRREAARPLRDEARPGRRTSRRSSTPSRRRAADAA